MWYDGTWHVRLIRNFRIGTSLSNRIRIGTSDSNSNRISKLRRSLHDSTTAVLVHFTRHITRLLEYNQYVRCLMIDFSKAFDTVNHVILLSKLVKFDLPGIVINWICSFLTARLLPAV